MKQYPFLDCKKGKIAFGVFMLTMLMLARDTLVTSCILGFNRSQFLMLGLILLVGIGFLLNYRKQWKDILLDKRMTVILVSTAVLLIPMAVKRDWRVMYFSILLCLYFAVFLTYFKSSQEVAKYYVVILTVLAAYSVLATYILKWPAYYKVVPIPRFRNDSDWPFLNFGFAFVVARKFWFRNFGIFREPGVYQFFLLLALYLNNYAVEWKKQRSLWIVNIVLAVTMMTTFATGGIIEMGLLAVFVYFDRKWYRTRWGKLGGAAAAAAVLGAAVFLLLRLRAGGIENTVYYEIFDMFNKLLNQTESSSDRMDSILTNIRIFLSSPLVGADIARILYAVQNNTSSTLILYAVFGFFGGTLNAAAWAALAWKKERNCFGNLFLLLILFMSFNTQNLIADVFFWLFPYMALTERVVPWLEKRRKV